MNKDIYNYLYNYFESVTNSNKKEIDGINKHFSNLEKFQQLKKITMEEKDLLVADMCKLVDYTIKKISNCPYLEIHIRKVIKEVKEIIRIEKEQQPPVSAIGFEYEDEQDFGDID